jgi:hypothetical protein
MKKFKLISFASLTLAVLFSVTACKKGDTGDTGPAGSTGSTGATGVQGPQGDQGNANVNTLIFSTTSSDWTWSSSFGNHYYSTDKAATNITQAIVDSGAVWVYAQFCTTCNWTALSYTDDVTVYPAYLFWSYNYGLNDIRFVEEPSNGTQPANPGVIKFKVVTATAAANRAHPGLNWNDYEAVQRAFNLPNN